MTKHSKDPDSFLSAMNFAYLSERLAQFSAYPQSIPSSWHSFFSKFTKDSQASDLPSAAFLKKRSSLKESSKQEIIDALQAFLLIRVYRVRGHLMADLDPLRLGKQESYADFELETYGFKSEDLEREIYINGELGFNSAKLKDIVAKLKEIYCGTIGIEFMHIQDSQQRLWIQQRFEKGKPSFLRDQKREILHYLLAAESLEKFLHVKFPGAKRFGLEGGEALIPALEALLGHVTQRGIQEVIMGMTHRGRINVLANILKQPLSDIFSQFKEEVVLSDNFSGSGDVKYHLGYSVDRIFGGKKLHLSLSPNASHLEATDPVILGKVRAKQEMRRDRQRLQVMGILLHGDAAFAGQGLVAETLELSGLKGFRTGGTLHIIINNQIGFTTSPPHSRSSPYSSDVGKIIQAPIIHVNGDDPEAVIWAFLMAEDFRHRFTQDVILDLVCYRRHGHNESDEPTFTQPLMYQAIAQKISVPTLYQAQLLKEGIINQETLDEITQNLHQHLQEEFVKAEKPEPIHPDWMKGAWMGIRLPYRTEEASFKSGVEEIVTGVCQEQLQEIGSKLLEVPIRFQLHPKIARQFEQKQKMLQAGKDIHWAMAETLAFGSLVVEGISIRFSGQDSGRGTFSQRHAILVNQTTEEKYIPLSHLALEKESFFEIVDSPLAEASVLGFEYGYSSATPHTLVIWEAQFGDFSNGAQVIIDQFVVSGEAKWSRLSGLVMLLPHGFEGQGPEHSSARLERFLQLCAEGNIQVANCSTPANYFHILRRQMKGSYRKPLILMTPKSLLRHPRAVSTLEEMAQGTMFTTVIPDPVFSVPVRRVVLCSGKVYYDLLEEKEKRGLQNIAIIRIEQFYPFPRKELLACLAPFKNAEIIWCQEEPLNMGAWIFMDQRMGSLLKELGATCPRWQGIGRPCAAAPATGLFSHHKMEQNKLMDEALKES